MKRFLALAALVLGLAACQTEPKGLDVIVGGEVETTVCVSLPEATRANSAVGALENQVLNGNYSLRYILEVYLGENCQRHVLVSDNTSVAFPVRLAPGRDYQLVVWADIVEEKKANGDVKTEDELKADRYYNTQNGLGNITIVDNTWNAMDETRDAFTATQAVSAQDIASGAITMKLKRPFAKLRVVATDYDDVEKLGLAPASAVVTYSQQMPHSFNALTGTASNVADKQHTISYATPVYEYKNGEFTLFADYFFADSDHNIAKFSLDVYADANRTNLIKTNNFTTEIFVEANKLTTIKGDVLTTGANINIDIEENGKFDEEDTYTYVNSGADLVKAINSNGKSVLGNNITVNEGDIALAGSLAATRSTDSKSVINLNGFTVTVNNKDVNGAALITLANNHTLVFAGKGGIVMTSESTAPFVNTKTNDAIVIIEQATVTNESTNQGAAVVDGNAIVNAAANVEADAVSGYVKPQLEYVLANGGEVTLFEDATSDKILTISTTNPVVIDLGYNTFTFTSNRGFRINENANVVIKNGSIVNNVSGGRCIETRAGGINLTLENVTLTATTGASQPFTVGGSGNDITVDINNSTIVAGTGYGYGITTFNPVALNINNSTITGYAALNIKPISSSLGSAGSVINVVNNSTLIGENNVPAGESNSFSTIMIEDNNIKINVDSTSIVKATTSNGNGQAIVGFGNSLVTSRISGCELTFAGEIVLKGEHTSYVGCSSYQGGLGGNIVKFAAEYADELEAEGWIVGESTDGLVTIPSAIAKVGDNLYKTLAEAVAAVEDGGTIILVENEVFTKNNRYNNGGWWDGLGYSGDKSFTIDLNNHSISQDGSLNDYLIWIKNNGTKANTITLKNGTLDAGKTAYCALATASSNAQKITINLENIELIGNNSNGAVAKIRGGAELNVKEGTVITGVNSYVGIECVGSATVVNIYEGAEIYQNGTTSSWGSLVGVSGNGTVNVHGGEGTSAKGGFMAMTSGGTINVYGGNWIANKNGTYANGNDSVLIAQSDKQYNAGAGNSVINVTGGTFKGGYNCYGNAVGDAQINIKGGNFNADPSSYLAEGKVAAQGADGCWTIVDGVKDEAGLKAAFEKGGNIVLGADITVSETVILAEGKTAVLDLNGFNITVPEAGENGKHIYALNNNGNMTIKDSKSNGSISARGIYNGAGNDGANITTAKLTIESGKFIGMDSDGGAAIFNYGELIVNNGIFNSIVASINTRDGSKATINGGTYSGGSNYVLQNNGGELTINNATVDSGFGAVGCYSGKTTINNGSFLPTGRPSATCHVVYVAGSADVTIKDGTFKMNYPTNAVPNSGSAVANYYKGTLAINGGTFYSHFDNVSPVELSSGSTITGGTYYTHSGEASQHVWIKNYIAEGYELNANGEVVKK